MTHDIKMAAKGKIGIIGSGLVGKSYCMLFISRGHPVSLYDISDDQLTNSLVDIREKLLSYERDGSLKGSLSAAEQLSLVSTTCNIEECVKDAFYIQECAFEKLDVKKQIMAQLDPIIGENTVVGSSTSCIKASDFTSDLSHRANILVVHPTNPPYWVPLVELIPAPWTSETAVTVARDLMASIGQSPVTLTREIPGFALNRIQYAIINECWNIVKSGVLSAEDMDKVISDGLGMRYAFIGPLETARLNANGLIDYFETYRRGILEVGQTYAPTPQYSAEEVAAVEREMAKKVPLDELERRRHWRDDNIAKLSILKQM